MHPMAPLVRTFLNAAVRVAPGPAGRLAFHVFVRPLGRARPKPEERAVMAAARVGRLRLRSGGDARGKEVVTYEWGDGRRPVLLVHGWSSRASRLGALAEALLARGYSPVAFDAPGHGDSPGRASNIVEYREIIRELHARHGDFHAVVAHSFGVLAALFALRDGVRTARFAGLGAVGSFAFLTAGFRERLGVDERVVRALRAHVERRIAPDEPGVWYRFEADHEPEALGAPLLLLHDEDDDMAPPSQSRLLVRAHGDRARLVATRGLGHRRILKDPDAVARVVEFVTAPAAEPSGERVAAG
ncbi:alpha/beta fold hydrolase [Streptomyces cinereoruber]|uniref:alpha/beta fold hydrolase n=1 Tax=Streptomyces cinereoruber TaxID=67260 RepID=UPI003C2CE1A9